MMDALGFLLKTLLALLAIGAAVLTFSYVTRRVRTRHFVDADLGEIEAHGGCAEGTISLSSGEIVSFELPANGDILVEEAKRLLLAALTNWQQVRGQFFEGFAKEILEDGLPEDVPRKHWIEKQARDVAVTALAKYTQMQRIRIIVPSWLGRMAVAVHSLHFWDPEHERVLILDETLTPIRFDIGVAIPH